MSCSICAESCMCFLKVLELFFVETLNQSHSPLFHFYKSALEPLPKFVVLSSPDIRTMPYGVLDEFLKLIDPLCFEHVFFDALDSDH